MAGQAKDEPKAGSKTEGTTLEDVASVAEARAKSNAATAEENKQRESPAAEIDPKKVNGEKPPVDDVDEDVNGDGEEGAGAGENAPDEALLERAIRAGMSMKEAKAVSDKEALASIVGRLETTKEKGDGKPADKKPESVLDKLPDLGSDAFEGYPAEIISALKAQQDVIRELHESLSKAQAGAGTPAPEKKPDAKESQEQAAAREKSATRAHRVVNQPRSSSGQFVPNSQEDSYEKRREAAVEEVRSMMKSD
jgi:hypothetical protein